MTKQEQDKQIIENAPKGATSVDADGFYYKHDGKYPERFLPNLGGWTTIPTHDWYIDFRPLDDIRELVALRDEVAEKDKRITKLERVMFDLLSLNSFHMSFPHEAQNLEQLHKQAKGTLLLGKNTTKYLLEGHKKIKGGDA